ncbi:disulfide bond formation protein B [Altererythrobacter xixiisoli]|uniref:Disulfide bond formation protein B n=1 Tax=Croceibacterium xixiisoli TaxID=1476466 RepID=A0A6I4U110_9SPHN|nr:disulfide bond formation protein B [Croceibacterium xixiisoli]MXP00638.1 disulfide bond formation protein B [Croceibacterium xixiisoli]
MKQALDLIGSSLLNRRLVGGAVLAIVLFTLAVDVAGLVHPCPYCRVQRFALGVTSIILLLKCYNALLCRYITTVVGLFGVVVGVSQNFNHIKKINSGKFDWSAVWIGHPWVLSGLAVLALCWLILLVFDAEKASPRG